MTTNSSVYFLTPKINTQEEFDSQKEALQNQINQSLGYQWKLTNTFNSPTDFSTPPFVFQTVPESIFCNRIENHVELGFEDGKVPNYNEQTLVKLKFTGTQYYAAENLKNGDNEFDIKSYTEQKTEIQKNIQLIYGYTWKLTDNYELLNDKNLDLINSSKENLENCTFLEINSQETTHKYWFRTELYQMDTDDLQTMFSFQMSPSWRIEKLPPLFKDITKEPVLTINHAETNNSVWGLVQVSYTNQLYFVVPEVTSDDIFNEKKVTFQDQIFQTISGNDIWVLTGKYQSAIEIFEKYGNSKFLNPLDHPDLSGQRCTALEIIKKEDAPDFVDPTELEDNSFFFDAIKNDNTDDLMAWYFQNSNKTYITNELQEGPIIYAAKHAQNFETMSMLIDVINCPLDVLSPSGNDAYIETLISGNVMMLKYFNEKQKDFVRDSKENEKAKNRGFEHFNFDVAENSEKFEKLKICLDYYAKMFGDSYSVLTAACIKGSFDTIKALVETLKYDVKNTGGTNLNCLLLSSIYPNCSVEILEYFYQKDPSMLEAVDSNNFDAFLHTVKANSPEKFNKLCELVGEDALKNWKKKLAERYDLNEGNIKTEEFCVACWTDPPTKGSVLCGHVVFCDDCYGEHNNPFCPLCKRTWVDEGMFNNLEEHTDLQSLFESLRHNLQILENPAMLQEQIDDESDDGTNDDDTDDDNDNQNNDGANF